MASLSSVDRPVPFSFEHAWEMTAADFERLNTFSVRLSARVHLRLAGLAVIGAAGLFWRYTAAVGVLALVFVAFILAMPWMARASLRSHFRDSAHLHGPVAYGVSSRGFWLRGETLGAESEWAGLKQWKEREGWLILFASGMPAVYLPLAGLKSAGLYEHVKTLARAHAREVVESPAAGSSAPAKAR